MSEQYVSLAEVNELLDKENLRRGEMGIELNAIQKSAMDHAQKNARLSKEDADALMKDLRELKFQTKDGEFVIPEYYVCKIADLLPKYKNDVRAIFYKERGINLEEGGIDEKIIETVSKYI